MAECFVDNDCPGVQLCYQNTSASWLPGGVNSCFCNTEYGWVGGPSCTEFGPATYYVAAVSGACTTLSLLLAMFTSFVLSSLMKNRTFKCNGLSFTLVLVLIETLLLAGRGIVMLTILYSPERQTVELTIQGVEVTRAHDLLVIIRVLVSLNVVFGFLAALHVSLVWLQIVEQSRKLSVKNKGVLATYPKFVFGVEGGILLMLIILGSIGSFGVIGLAVLPFLVMAVALYSFGVWKLGTLLSTIDGKSTSGYRSTISYIKQCYAGVLFSSILLFIGGIGLGVLSVQGYKESTPAGEISLYVILNEMTPWGLCLMVASILLYVYRCVKKNMSSSGQLSKKKSNKSTPSKDPLKTPTTKLGFEQPESISEAPSV